MWLLCPLGRRLVTRRTARAAAQSPTTAAMKRKTTDGARASKERRPQKIDARLAAAQSLPAVPATEARTESAAALHAVVETVRRVMRADTTAVAGFSLVDKTITWKATSGFRARTGTQELVMPLRGPIAERAATTEELLLLEGVGVSDRLPAEDFPLHSAEGVRDVALAPLRVRGEPLGVLVVGYRTAHSLSIEERQVLEGLAEMAALALDNTRLLEIVTTSKKIWEQTVDAIPDGIIVHDAEMRITRCNATAAEALGYEQPTEVIGMSCAEAFARLFGERAAAYHMSRTAGAATSFEIQAEDRRRYLVAVAPLTSPTESLESGVARLESKTSSASDSSLQPPDSRLQSSWSVITWSDVTTLSEVQEQLARSRRLATVGQLAAGVAHEINNPLAAITTCAEATLRDLRQAPDEWRAFSTERNWPFYLEEIVRQALRCKSITRGLLDLSRQRRARRAACDINALVARSVTLLVQQAAERGIEVRTELDRAVGEVATDETMVRQILDNLLTNALDAVGAQGGRVTVATAPHVERVTIEVADTGPGIAPELLARIFDPFFTTKEPGQGSGLGLAISTALAEALGGALTVESKLGAGSRFRLWLPKHPPEPGDAG
jgi:two-component system NtrC family sensor kinase